MSSETDRLVDEPKPTGIDAAPTWLKAVILLCICSMTTGSYFCFDIPGAIQKQLTDWFPNYNEDSNALLYSIYSWPNCVLALFGGILVDRYLGVRRGALLFVTLIWAGQVVFTVGVQSKTYWLCVVGRFLFGLGGESLTVTQNAFTIRWFKGPKLALVFGLVLAFARVGSSINFAITPPLANSGVLGAILVGTGVATYSLVMVSILCLLDRYGNKYIEEQKAIDALTTSDEQKESAERGFRLRDLASFTRGTWVMFFICAFLYVGVLVFYQVASVIMQETGFHFSPSTATLMLAIPNFMSIFCSPMFGTLIDRVGYSLTLLLCASWTLTLVHVGFLANAYGAVSIHPIILMVILGFSYSAAATMWTNIPALLRGQEELVSTAYGLMTSIQNIALSVFPLFIARLQNIEGIAGTPHKFGVPIIVFVACVFLSSNLISALYFIDIKDYNGRVNASAKMKMLMDAPEVNSTEEMP